MLNVNADDSFPDSNAETSAVASVSPSLLKTHTGLSLVYRGMIVSFALGLLALVTPFLLYSGLVSSRFFLGILGSVAAVTWLMLFTGAYLCLAHASFSLWSVPLFVSSPFFPGRGLVTLLPGIYPSVPPHVFHLVFTPFLPTLFTRDLEPS